MPNPTQISVLDGGGVARTVSTNDALLAKLADDPSTEATLASFEATNHADLAALLEKITNDPATQTTLAEFLAANHTDLVAVASKLDTLNTDLVTTLAGYVDGIEALIGTSNSSLSSILTALTSTIAGYVDGLETLVTGSNTKLDIIHTDLGTTLAGLLTDLKGYTDQLEGYVDGLETLVASTNTKLDTLAASTAAISAGENHIGSVGGNTSYIDVTLSLDTSAYATGDLMADTQVVTNAMRVNDGTGVLQSIQVLDEDDQGIAFDLVLLSANNSLGTENSAPSVTDANARDILGFVSIGLADFIDLGGCRIATKTGVGLVVKAASSTRNLYVAAIARGAPTYTASGVRLRLGFLQD